MYFGHIHPQPLFLILPRLLTLDKLGALFFSSNNPLTPMFAAPILLHVGPSAGGCSISQKPHTPWKKTYSPSPRSHQPFRAPQLVMTDEGLWTSFSFHGRMSVAYLRQVFFDQPQLLWVRQCRGHVQTLVSPTSDLTILLPSLKHWGPICVWEIHRQHSTLSPLVYFWASRCPLHKEISLMALESITNLSVETHKFRERFDTMCI